MADMDLLPPPNIPGCTKPKVVSKPQLDPIHIQIPCSLSCYDNQTQQWELVSPQAIIQLVNHSSPTTDPVNKEIIRVLNLQNMPILDQPLTDLKWSKLNDIAYELDIQLNKSVVDVYAIKFNSEQDAARFNQVFEGINNRNANALYPFLQPLTDAIRRGDVVDACRRFRFLCEFKDRDRNFVIRAEKPLTPEEIEMQKSVKVTIPVENCDGSQCEIVLRVPKDSTIADLKEIMYLKYEIPKEVQKWLDEQSLLKNSEPILNKEGEPRNIFLYILNAAKVGLNKEEFMGKLEAYKKKLQKKQTQAQPQFPMDDEEVPMPAQLVGGAPFSEPVGPGKPGEIPVGSLDRSYPKASPMDQPTQPVTYPEEQIVTIPGTLWGCPGPDCKHVNAWENIKCEKCRRERPNELPQ